MKYAWETNLPSIDDFAKKVMSDQQSKFGSYSHLPASYWEARDKRDREAEKEEVINKEKRIKEEIAREKQYQVYREEEAMDAKIMKEGEATGRYYCRKCGCRTDTSRNCMLTLCDACVCAKREG